MLTELGVRSTGELDPLLVSTAKAAGNTIFINGNKFLRKKDAILLSEILSNKVYSLHNYNISRPTFLCFIWTERGGPPVPFAY